MIAAQTFFRSILVAAASAAIVGCAADQDPPAQPPGAETRSSTAEKQAASTASKAPQRTPPAGGSVPANDGLDDIRERADQIERRAPELQQVKGETTADDISAQFMAYLDEKGVVLIESMMGDIAGSPAFDTYYFADGRMFRYQSFRARDNGSDGSPDQVLVEMLFDEDGNLAKAVTEVNGKAETTPDSEVRAAFRRAEDLLDAAHSR